MSSNSVAGVDEAGAMPGKKPLKICRRLGQAPALSGPLLTEVAGELQQKCHKWI